MGLRTKKEFRKEVVDHDAVGIHDIMGLSCLLYLIPCVVYFLYASGDGVHITFARVFGVLFVWCSVFSFLGDYYYTGTKGTSTEALCTDQGVVDDVAAASEVPSWQKQWVCNKIDRMTVITCTTIGCAMMIFQSFYATQMRWIYPTAYCVFGIAAVPKYLANKNSERFLELADSDGYGSKQARDAVWNANFYHSLWHVLSSFPLTIQMYGLVAHGFSIPWWLSCCL